ncbi:MAG TPA: DNA repair protein RadC, partial [Arenibaculum sp.]|nr:DNA repair protein RadC [Arenibaculum sp.]
MPKGNIIADDTIADDPAAGSGSTVREDAPHYLGQRSRLRARYIEGGDTALQDYELLELILFPALPRRDVKPIAKRLLKELGSLWQVANASPARLLEAGLGEPAAVTISAIGAVALRMKRQDLMNRPVLSSWQRLLDYCEAAMADNDVEQFRLLFLDRKNRLIADEVQQRGTVDQVAVYPREVIKRALDLGASALILVHNHPSGDPTPSRADIDMTHAVTQA